MESAKHEALKLIDGLPEEATWEEILYKLYVKKRLKQESKRPTRAELYHMRK